MTGAIVVCTWGSGREGVPDGAEEVLTLARRVSGALQADLNWLVLGTMPERTVQVAARYGVAGVDHVGDPRLDTFQPDLYVEALAQYCGRQSPKVLLFSQAYGTRLMAPRLAGRLGCAVVMNGVDIDVAGEGRLEVTASGYGGDTRSRYVLGGAAPHIVAVLPNAVLPEPLQGATASPPVRAIDVDLSGDAERVRVLEPARAEGPRLEDAEIIVSGGRGLGKPENYKLIEELAEALGGMPGASRPIVDDGWTDPSRWIGLTGKIVRPNLYIACGISGASQHMAGCSAAKTLVAINRDPDASIFRYARYGIVGDCLEIVPELIRALEKR
ncbi:MAG TPA: electron transfer flavoprotein subunit alpha/FixB family protein [Dehalococcoidia bacterium]|nr:electron transfer flavoprotein subunit alpha/FixB family protein [Dehalococcoidia bacterium]